MNATRKAYERNVSTILRDSEGRFTFAAGNADAGGRRNYCTFPGGDGLALYTGEDNDVCSGIGVGWKQIVGTAQRPFHEADPLPATFRARVVRYFGPDE